ncbi:MAG: DUF1800 family protein [Deltaproteobacteria bacterium]|nr:DUF1800 family protein [Deltaproteobacteria bacterium]
MIKKIFVLLSCVLLLAIPDSALAAKKGKKKGPKKPKKELDLSKVVKVQVQVTQGKVTKSYDVTCYGNEPGQMKGKNFTPMSKVVSQYKGRARFDKKAKKKYALYRAIQKAGKEECNQPGHLSLAPYNGAFGEAEARILYDRFSFGASPELIAHSARIGLEATVNEIMAYKSEPQFDADEIELRCDGYLADDSRNESFMFDECPPGNRNAVRDTGVRFDIYNRMWRSNNGYYHKLAHFLHDERMAAGSNVLNSTDRYALVDHVAMLRRAAASGDYIQFMREWNDDYLGHLVWLDGRSNSGDSPNENYAREFWELGTVGPTGLDGLPVYSDLDIAQSALAFSGWIRECADFLDSLGNEYEACFGAKAPLRHAPGAKTIFIGTPWQATVDTDADVLNATFNHPRTAEHLAEDIWKEFINPYAREKEIRQLAQLIRDSNYKLHPVFRKIMMSRAMFDQKSRKTLIKSPIEMAIGFLRHTGIPVIDSIYFDEDDGVYRTSSNRFENLEWNVIDELGEIPTLPPTVFGWNERRLAGEQWVLPWRNAVVWILNQDSDDLEERGGFSYRTRFFSGLPAAGTAAPVLVDNIAAMLNVPLTDAQKAHLVQFLDYDYVQCSNSEKQDPTKGCDADGNRLKYRVFDPHPESDDVNVTDLRGVIAAIAMQTAYRLK